MLPKGLRLGLHRCQAWLVAAAFGFPARHLTVVAVTGTNGKSTVVALIGQLLRDAGKRVGWVSTATIRIGGTETLNATKLTTPSPAFLQQNLRAMVRDGCTHAILEASSEGLEQGRLNGVNPEVAVFTNLTPEHIEAHGSFEDYALAKERLFKKLSSAKHRGRSTCSVANIDDPVAGRYLKYPADLKIGCTLGTPRAKVAEDVKVVCAERIVDDADGGSFQVNGVSFATPLVGRFNVMNLLEAIAAVHELGVPLEEIAKIVPKLLPVPGRMEFLHDLHLPFRVLVDYAPEPASMQALYSVLPRFNARRIIHVFGSAGGGRDRARRPILGKFVTEHADIGIITNEDPYDEDPKQILQDISVGTEQASPHRAKVEIVFDRHDAIRRAMTVAGEGDLIVVSGKACEQWIMGPHGTKIPWDDRRAIREIAGELRGTASGAKSEG